MVDEDTPWPIEHGTELRRQAKKQFGRGVRLTGLDDDEAEESLRTALATAASAFNWLEGSDFEVDAHDDLHRYGRYTRENNPSGCELGWTGSGYEHRCPVAIAHKRIGFSIGFTGQRFCSICDADLSECEHTPGRFYDVVGRTDDSGQCVVCRKDHCTEHTVGETYRARAAGVIRQAEIHEVSLVAMPKQPDARLAAIPIDTARLQERLGPGFKIGMRVSCDQCLQPCPGLDKPFDRMGGGHA